MSGEGALVNVHVVWKFDLGSGVNELPMPQGSQVLYATVQHDMPVIYFLVNPENQRGNRRVRVVATGEPFDAPATVEPAGLLIMADGALMFHVFVWPE